MQLFYCFFYLCFKSNSRCNLVTNCWIYVGLRRVHFLMDAIARDTFPFYLLRR
uniref:Uncharacterized protein n=1 Tax=Rhizophora mucronata TaxID=61149 RepID=A0A2P2Q649_RHIMU